jgi:hypothetical protein
VGMARRKNAMMKFVVPAALTLGKRVVTRWPLLAAAVGGAFAYGMWSRHRGRSLTRSTAKVWAAKNVDDAKAEQDELGTTLDGARVTVSSVSWSPTGPNVAW